MISSFGTPQPTGLGIVADGVPKGVDDTAAALKEVRRAGYPIEAYFTRHHEPLRTCSRIEFPCIELSSRLRNVFRTALIRDRLAPIIATAILGLILRVPPLAYGPSEMRRHSDLRETLLYRLVGVQNCGTKPFRFEGCSMVDTA